MLFQQIFDERSCTLSYLIAARRGGEAIIIDPVDAKLDVYLAAIAAGGFRLVKALDTHIHADHVSGLPRLRDSTRCATVMGERSRADVVGIRVADGETLRVDGLAFEAIYTPGHTDDSYSFRLDDRVFTGDTLLIEGTGRTDFQNGDARAQHDSIFRRLLTLPDDTKVFPAHDYKGRTVSTIGHERAANPRLQVRSAEEYAALMAGLRLPRPEMMDVAVPANLRMGLDQGAPGRAERFVSPEQADALRRRGAVTVDLRDPEQSARRGSPPGALAVPHAALAAALAAGGALRTGTSPWLFVCDHGELAALAAEQARDAGMTAAWAVRGGLAAWTAA